MNLDYRVIPHGLCGQWRWRIEARVSEPDEQRLRPLLADFYQPSYQQPYVSQEAAERAGEEFLTQLAKSPPRA